MGKIHNIHKMIRCKTRLESVPKKNYTHIVDQCFANNLILPILQELYEFSFTDPFRSLDPNSKRICTINNNIRWTRPI